MRCHVPATALMTASPTPTATFGSNSRSSASSCASTYDTLDFDVYDDAPSGYSIGIDARGRVFTNTGHRLDPGSGAWQLAAGSVLLGASQGAEDNDGLLWTNATSLEE